MAYVSSNPDDETLNEGGPLVPGGAPTPSAPTTGATSPAAGQKPKTSGRFADLGEYLRVNAPQQFGSQLAGKIGQDVDTAGNQLGQASDEFKSRADAGTIKDDQGLIGQVGTNPEGVDAGAFSKLRDASYGGPTNFSNASDLYNQTTGQANAAESKANASKTEGGRFALLDSYYGKPQYSQGQKSLDNLLVQNDPNSQQAFKQIQDNARALQSNVAQTGNQLTAYGNQAKAATDATRTSARSALGIDDAGAATGTGAIGDLNNQINNNFSSRQSAQQTELDMLKKALSSKDISGLSADERKQLGLDKVDYLYGADPSQYLSNPELTKLGVTSPEQVARMRALSKLGELNDPYADIDESVLGTQANSPLFNYNTQGLQNDISSRSALNDAALRNAYNADQEFGVDTSSRSGFSPMALDKAALSQQGAIPYWQNELSRFGYGSSPSEINRALATGGNPAYLAQRLKAINDLEDKYQSVKSKYAPTDPLKK